MRRLAVLILTISLFVGVFTFPYTEKSVSNEKTKSIKTHADAFKFLVTLGYNPCAGKMTSFCRQSLESMLESYQTTYSLPVTKKLDAATLKLMNSPKSTQSNSETIPRREDKLWPTDRTLTWRLEDSKKKLFSDRESIGNDIQQAFDVWAQYCPLTFREATKYEKADFNLAFVSGKGNGTFPFSDGPGGTIVYSYDPWGEFRGVIHFDSAEKWSQKHNAPSSHNFRLAAIHEIGHSLGLKHSFNEDSIMYMAYQVPKSITDPLSSEDVNNIQALYGKPI